MIPPITHATAILETPKITKNKFILPSNFHHLSFLDQLKCIGFIDNQYNLLFNPKEIPPIPERGQKRYQELLKKEVHCPNATVKLSEYIPGLAKDLLNRGIESKTYLRGGYAAYVACTDDYFEYLLQEHLADMGLPIDLIKIPQDASEEPHDVDLFDFVDNGMSPQFFSDYYLDYMFGLTKTKLEFLQRLIPKTSKRFPFEEKYALFTIGNKKFQVDRIIGKLNHPYLFKRDDIRINLQTFVPESSGNFWQMILERKLKIVRTEPWHELDFRAGLAVIQLVQNDHILIEEGCTLRAMMRHALSIGSEKGAIDRAKLHCKQPYGFLLSVLIAYLHEDPAANLQILKGEIGVIPSLGSLYKLALLMTLYKCKDYSAVWEPSGLLILNWNGEKIIFPKNFVLTSKDQCFNFDKWEIVPATQLDSIYYILDQELSPLERVLFELALQKYPAPLTESMKDALVDYLLEEDGANIAPLFFEWFTFIPGKLGWTKILLTHSIRHGLKVWNSLEKKSKLQILESVIDIVSENRPNQAYAMLDVASPPKSHLLEKILKSSKICPETAVRIMEELIIENVADAARLFQAYRNIFNKTNDYVRYIKLFNLPQLAKEWIESFPPKDRMNQALDFHEQPLLDAIAELPGINEAKLMEALLLKGHPVFEGRSFSKLMALINKVEAKQEVLKALAKLPFTSKEAATLQDWMKKNPAFGLDLAALLIEESEGFLIGLKHLIHLKKNTPLWEKALSRCTSPEALYALIPFYKTREWIKSVYGVEADAKTKQWAKALVASNNLNETDKGTVRNILTRTKLTATPLALLKNYLESLKNIPICRDKVKFELDELIKAMQKAIKLKIPTRFYCLEILYRALKLGFAAGLLSDDLLRLIEESAPYATPHIHEKGAFDPMLQLLQTLPPVDLGSEKLHYEFQARRINLYMTRGLNADKIAILDYPLLQQCQKYAHLYKLITEKYIEGKVSKEEFQFEIRSLANAFTKKGLLAHEAPSLICINDLSFYLRKDKRIKAYEAFHFILAQHNGEIYNQQAQYLKQRRDTEDFIISRTAASIKDGQLYAPYLASIGNYIRTKLHLVTNLPFQDPIFDAFMLESIHPLTRADFTTSLKHELMNMGTPLHAYYANFVMSAYEFQKSQLQPPTVYNALLEQIEKLKGKASKEEKHTEATLIYRSARVYFAHDKWLIDKIGAHLTRATGQRFQMFTVHEMAEEKSPIKFQEDFHTACKIYMDYILTDGPPEHYQFHTLLQLIGTGLEDMEFDLEECFDRLRLILPKAHEYALIIDNQLIYDPYFDLLQSFNLIDFKSQEKFTRCLDTSCELINKWDASLRQAVPTIKHKALKLYGYAEVSNILSVVERLKVSIDQFIREVVTEKEFKSAIESLLASLQKRIMVEMLTRESDPCLKVISWIPSHERAYKALDYMLEHWGKIVPSQLANVKEYRAYLNTKNALEHLIVNLKLKKTRYLLYFVEIKQYMDMQIIHDNIHLLDPVFDALQLDGIERIERIELMKHWEKVLKNCKNPFHQYQAKKVASYIAFESKKINDKDLVIFSGAWTVSFHRANQMSQEAFNTEQLAYLDVISNYQNPEHIQLLPLETVNTSKLLEMFTTTETTSNAVLLNFLESLAEKKIPPHELQTYYFLTLDSLAEEIKETPHFHKFHILTDLINRGIEYNYDGAKCLAPLDLIKDKAVEFLCEADNQVLFDPFVDLLQSLSLYLINSSKSEEDYNTLKKMLQKIFHDWMQTLESAKKPKKHKTLKFLSYDDTSIARLSSCTLNLYMGEYIKHKVSKEKYLKNLSDLLTAITKDIPYKTFTRHTDPCIGAIKDILLALQFDGDHKIYYEAMEWLLQLWSKKAPHLTYVQDYQNYIFARMELIELTAKFKVNDQPYLQFYEIMEKYLKGLPLENIHILDPVLFHLPLIEQIELSKLWIKVLKEAHTPIAEYLAKKVMSWLDWSMKKLKKNHIDNFISQRIIKLKKVQNLPIFDKELDHFFSIAQIYCTGDEMKEMPERIRQAIKNV